MDLRNLAGIGLLLMAVLFSGCRREHEWVETFSQVIRKQFPDVEHLSTRQLSDWLADPARSQPILLDARSEEEYQVSHLPGALFLDGGTEASLRSGSLSQPIVVYCSIGWRSSQAARRLRETGFEQVYNLEGSIFLWANEGRPIYQDERRASVVHPYDPIWERLLKPGLRWRRDATAGSPAE